MQMAWECRELECCPYCTCYIAQVSNGPFFSCRAFDIASATTFVWCGRLNKSYQVMLAQRLADLCFFATISPTVLRLYWCRGTAVASAGPKKKSGVWRVSRSMG